MDNAKDYDIYLRKSRKDVEFSGDESIEKTLARHEKQLQEFAIKLFGEKIPEENIFREVVSGDTIEDRPQMQEILHRIEDGSRKGILVIEIERLARGNTIDQGIIAQAFEYSNTKILTPMKTFDLNDEFDKSFFEDGLYQARKYLMYTKKILNRGRIQSVKEGKYIGSQTPFGYNKVKLEGQKGYKLIQNEEADTVRLIFKLFLEDNMGTSNISHYLNNIQAKARVSDVWTPFMIRNILIKPVYCGKLTWNKRKTEKKLINGVIKKTRPLQKDYIFVNGLHEGIITEEEWYKVQNKLKSNSAKKVPDNKQMKNPLAGLIKCGVCGRNMVRRPYYDAIVKKHKRIYKIDKTQLNEFLCKYKEKSGLSLTEIAKKMNISKYVVDHWFSKAKTVIPAYDKWFELKKVLNIDSDIFDKQITAIENKKTFRHQDSLMCSLPRCANISSDLSIVEKKLIKVIKEQLIIYSEYVNNYEEEFKKQVNDNSLIIKNIEKEISKLEKQYDKICELLETGIYTPETFKERSIMIKTKIESNNLQKEKMETEMKENKLIIYKKIIPKMEYFLNVYEKLENAEDKNKILQTIITNAVYTKTINTRWKPELKEKFDLIVNIKL